MTDKQIDSLVIFLMFGPLEATRLLTEPRTVSRAAMTIISAVILIPWMILWLPITMIVLLAVAFWEIVTMDY